MIGDSVGDYVTQARVLLQDQVEPFRYPDTELIAALNLAVSEAARVRPDFFYGTQPPSFSASTDTATTIPSVYRVAVLHFVVGHTELRDAETTEETRAAALISSFHAKLTGAAPGQAAGV